MNLTAPKLFKALKGKTSHLLGADFTLAPSVDMTNTTREDDPSLYLPYDLKYLTSALIETAREELGETDEVRHMALNQLIELIKEEENLFCFMEENFLLQFLRARKFNVQRAFKLLQNYYRFREEQRDVYDNADSELVKQIILQNTVGLLDNRDKMGSLVFLVKIGLWNPDLIPIRHVMLVVTALLSFGNVFPATQVAGYRIIFDCRGLSWHQMKHCTPQNLYLLIRSTQFCFPARYKGIHTLSDNKLFNFGMAISYPLLTKKLKKRIFHHKMDVNALHEFIHPSILPVEYGGMLGPFDNTARTPVIDEYASYVMGLIKYGYNK